MISDKISLIKLFESFHKLNVLILGDLMVDTYIWGKVERISPEAPVPIVSVNKKENRLGGAGNVAINIKSLGANPIVCSVIGKDNGANILLELLEKNKMRTDTILKSEDRKTTVKTRIIGNKHHLLRVDEEDTSFMSNTDKENFLKIINKIINDYKINIIIFQDYDKGVLDEYIIKSVIEIAQKNNIPTTADPKKRNFLKFTNVDLFKPNLKELNEGINAGIEQFSLDIIKESIKKLRRIMPHKNTMLTLSDKGIYIENNNISKYFDAQVRDVADVSGAGDTVISIASLCLALNCDLDTIAFLSNIAGGIVCEEVGVVPINKNKLLNECIKIINNGNKGN